MDYRKFALILSCLIFLASCNAEAPDRLHEMSILPDHKCGSITPTYFYFSEIAPKLGYPNYYTIDIDEFYTRENLEKHLSGLHELGRLSYWPSISSGSIKKRFQSEDIDCWAKLGDQISILSTRSESLKLLYKSFAYTGIDSSWTYHEYSLPDALIQEKGAEIRRQIDIAEIKEDIRQLVQAASFAKLDCTPVRDPRHFGESDCNPVTMLRAFSLGVADAHAHLAHIYYAGPKEIRDAQLAELHWISAALLGWGPAYRENPYKCEHSDIYRNYPVLRERMWDILDIDVNIVNKRAKLKSLLRKCI